MNRHWLNSTVFCRCRCRSVGVSPFMSSRADAHRQLNGTTTTYRRYAWHCIALHCTRLQQSALHIPPELNKWKTFIAPKFNYISVVRHRLADVDIDNTWNTKFFFSKHTILLLNKFRTQKQKDWPGPGPGSGMDRFFECCASRWRSCVPHSAANIGIYLFLMGYLTNPTAGEHKHELKERKKHIFQPSTHSRPSSVGALLSFWSVHIRFFSSAVHKPYVLIKSSFVSLTRR